MNDVVPHDLRSATGEAASTRGVGVPHTLQVLAGLDDSLRFCNPAARCVVNLDTA